MRRSFDLVAIGGGSAGLVSAAVAAGLGARVALIERERLGGECLWTGCVPSKALLHAARVAHLANTAGACGLRIAPVARADAAGVLAAVRASRETVREADAVEPLLRDLGVTILHGRGRFTSPHHFRTEAEEVRSRFFVLATGSRPHIPPIRGLHESGFLTNLTVFDLPEPPPRLAVLGGGPIGVELAQAFQRLGTQVTLIHHGPRLLRRDDAELAVALQDILAQEGVDLRLSARVFEVHRDGSRRYLTVESWDGTDEVLEVDEVLVATGRRPNTEGLGLEEIGVRVDEQGVLVTPYLRTAVPHIFACGDVVGLASYSHMAEEMAKAAVQNALLPISRRLRWDRVPWCTFTDPELAHAGWTAFQAGQKHIPVDVFSYPFHRDDRAQVDREAHGWVKLVAARSGGRLLGAQILGPRAGEVIQEAILAMEHGLTVRHLADSVHIYPTLGVAVQRAAQHWWKQQGENPLLQGTLRRYLDLFRA